jgi:predicted nucleic acid-binding protein
MVRSGARARWSILGPAYLDSSALAKIYLPESSSEELDRAIKGRRDLLLSDLAVTEVTSALARRRREGHLPGEAATRFHEALLEDLAAGFFNMVGLDPDTHREAERLLLSCSVSLRAADALHLAMATAEGAASIITFDLRLAQAASEISLPTVPELSGTRRQG